MRRTRGALFTVLCCSSIRLFTLFFCLLYMSITCRLRVGFAMGLPGADIIFLEAVLSRGGDIYVVLPCPRAEFEAEFLECDDAPLATTSSRGNTLNVNGSGSLQSSEKKASTARGYWNRIKAFVHQKDGMRWKARMRSIFYRAKVGHAFALCAGVSERTHATVLPALCEPHHRQIPTPTRGLTRSLTAHLRGGPRGSAAQPIRDGVLFPCHGGLGDQDGKQHRCARRRG